MEDLKIEDIDYTDHKRKCRICFKSFNADEHRFKITKLENQKFYALTQTNLRLSSEFSKEICSICNYQLTNFAQLKRNIISSQERLYSYVRKEIREIVTVEKCEEVFIIQDVEQMKSVSTLDHNDLMGYADPMDEENSCTKDSLQKLSAIKSNQENRRRFGKVGSNQCAFCDVKIIAKSQMLRHVERVHLKIKNFNCDQCSFKSYFKYTMSSHVRSHIDRELRRNFACCKCDYITVSKNSLRGHEAKHHGKARDYECSICNEHFETYNQLYRHKLKMHKEMDEKYICNQCNKSLKCALSLKNHIANMHSMTESTIPCPVEDCKRTCITNKQLQNHIKTHNADSKEICPECGLLVANKHNLQKHINRVHKRLRNYSCDLCEYRGFFKFNIVEHMKKHLDMSEREKHYCDEIGCNFQSVSKTSLRSHKRSEHMGMKRTFLCICGKSFSQNSSYYTHVKIVHEKLKKHACNICSKTFFERAQLKNHVKSQHLKQKDLPCSACQKMFSTRKHLQSHMKYHEAPQYPCTVENCTNSFYTPSQLNSHIKVHNNIRDFKCTFDHCEKSYFHKSHLKKHLLTHGIV